MVNLEQCAIIIRQICDATEPGKKMVQKLFYLMEVINAIMKLKGYKMEEVYEVMKVKSDKKGAFNDKIYLEYVDEDKRNIE